MNSLIRTIFAPGRKTRMVLLACLAFGLFRASLLPLNAQSIDPALLRNLQNRPVENVEQDSPLSQARESTEERDIELARETARENAETVSPLERDYQNRADRFIPQFGYDIFAQVALDAGALVGEISDDYVLGIGDQLVVSFVGSQDRSVTTRIDSEGRLVLPDMPPVTAAGRTFAEFVGDLEAQVSAAMLGTEVFVSLGAVRQANVYVMGEVALPGLYNMNSLSSVMQALARAGGVKKSGSLRNISVEMDGQSYAVDLYDLMLSGKSPGVQLRDGARIVVRPIGPTIAVYGRVSRPGIFELQLGEDGLVWSSAQELAGGTLRPRGNVAYASRFDDMGLEQVVALDGANAVISSGDLINVMYSQDARVGSVELLGHVSVPGPRSLQVAPTISALINGVRGLGDEPYLPFAVLETIDEASRARIYRDINIGNIFAGVEDVRLKSDDKLYVFGMEDVRYASSENVRISIVLGQAQDQCEASQHAASFAAQFGRDRFRTLMGSVFIQTSELVSAADQAEDEDRRDSRLDEIDPRLLRGEGQTEEDERDAVRSLESQSDFGSEGVLSIGDSASLVSRECSQLLEEEPNLLVYMLEYGAGVSGRVRRPGVYPVSGGADVATMVAYAGGYALDADIAQLEITALSDQGAVNRIALTAQASRDHLVSAGDVLRVHSRENDMEEGTILLGGEVRRPGVYTIISGERLSGLLERAGGLTDYAYPYGAVFTRESAKEQQRAALARAAREIDSALAVAAVRSNVEAGALAAAKDLAQELATSEVLGRVVIEADPTVLRVRPELDTVLSPGDSLYIPKRPNYVTLAGDVLNPGALQFISGKGVEDYLAEAGGFQRSADEKRVFLVFPNGAATPVKTSGWSKDDTPVLPGSVIVVPKNLDPITGLDIMTSVSQIISQLAISAASIAVISQ